jgi:hypothetical protein
MTQQEWEPAQMRRLAEDLRRFTEAVRGYDCSRIKRLAAELDLEATEMEASKAGQLQRSRTRHH